MQPLTRQKPAEQALKELGDRELEETLTRLEGRIRVAIALGESSLLDDLIAAYLKADAESTRRFDAWIESADNRLANALAPALAARAS